MIQCGYLDNAEQSIAKYGSDSDKLIALRVQKLYADKYQKILYNRKVFSILVDLGLKILPCGGGSVLVVTQREVFLPFLFYKSLFKG